MEICVRCYSFDSLVLLNYTFGPCCLKCLYVVDLAAHLSWLYTLVTVNSVVVYALNEASYVRQQTDSFIAEVYIERELIVCQRTLFVEDTLQNQFELCIMVIWLVFMT